LSLHEHTVVEPAVSTSDLRANILLVDDHPDNLTALEAILTPLNENLLRATSGLDALRHVLNHEISVILMDVQMPTMDGFETARMIREREKSAHIPIIFITAISKDQEAMFHGYAIGAVDYIAKPFNPDILLSKVRVFVDLNKKNEQIKRQAELIHQAELRETERRQEERERQLEQERLRALQSELELRVAERTAQLVAANSEMEAFCYSVSHDLRAPLRAIMSTSMILLQEAQEKLNDEEVDQLRRQSSAAKRLGSLIDDLLQLSRLGRKKLELEKLDISSISEEIASDLAMRYSDHAIKMNIQPGLVANADQGLIRIMLYNLLDNAFKYSPNGGEITIGHDESNGLDSFFVSDSGIGFEMKYARKLFLPFERLVLDKEFPGTGIGLAIVHRIVLRHGGKVWAEGVPGQGATFRFTLA
jgi:two-component system, sensor histidine kinase and response regulator